MGRKSQTREKEIILTLVPDSSRSGSRKTSSPTVMELFNCLASGLPTLEIYRPSPSREAVFPIGRCLDSLLPTCCVYLGQQLNFYVIIRKT